MIVVSLALGFAIDNVSCAYGWIYEMEEGHHRFRHLGAPVVRWQGLLRSSLFWRLSPQLW